MDSKDTTPSTSSPSQAHEPISNRRGDEYDDISDGDVIKDGQVIGEAGDDDDDDDDDEFDDTDDELDEEEDETPS